MRAIGGGGSDSCGKHKLHVWNVSANSCEHPTHQHSTHRGARTHDHKVKGLALYRLS